MAVPTLRKKREGLATRRGRFGFHVTVAQASGNSLLFDLICLIRNQLVNALSKLLLPHVMPLSIKEHEPIVKALKRHRETMGKSTPVDAIPAPKKRARPRPAETPLILRKVRSSLKSR